MATQLQTEQGVVRVPTGKWHVDPAHSSVEFEVKHMMIATVRGRFKEFEGTIEAHEDVAHSRVYGVVKTASIDTNEPDRDAHLRSPDFLDTERYPESRFESKRIEPLGGTKYRVVGDLTIKDVTREVELEACVEGAERDPWGNDRVGVRLRGSINRTDFGLSWQRLLESGGFLVGEEVKILADISAVRADEE
ncbi:MAG: YceI family protein [Gaiellaceae bacterium]